MGLTDFILMGHSFGGYNCGVYTSLYPEHIRMLVLLSPLGVPEKPENFDFDAEIKNFPADRRLPKLFYKATKVLWKVKMSPYKFLRVCGPLTDALLSTFVKKRLKDANLPPEQLADYKVYLKETLPRPASTELILYQLFDNEMFAKTPLSSPERLLKLQVPVHFVFGSIDWMR